MKRLTFLVSMNVKDNTSIEELQPKIQNVIEMYDHQFIDTFFSTYVGYYKNVRLEQLSENIIYQEK